MIKKVFIISIPYVALLMVLNEYNPSLSFGWVWLCWFVGYTTGIFMGRGTK